MDQIVIEDKILSSPPFIHLPSNSPHSQSLPLSLKAMFDPRSQPHSNNKSIPTREIYHNENYIRSSSPMSFGPRARKTAQNYENYRNSHGGGLQFRGENTEDESGFSSPPLWKTSPPVSPQRNYRTLSPNSRSQAIARGQWELMEMVKKLPESCYELSLKDLVQHPRVNDQESCLVGEKILIVRQGSKRNDGKAEMMRSRSVENGGFLLKMVFPFSLRSIKKNKIKKETPISSCARVSPRTEVSSKGVDSGNSSGRSSRSNSSRHKSGCSTPGCWPFIFCNKINKTSK
ncbi:hypothetical protein CEY00_Acc12287 [Actinidia chinensis var. chinensis]|uniref:Uncharacterized protein n=1 Tax=Actinidia chinensis var. chinensis TaxID=1590841 RepID=A0A2R6QYP8_ACTCC|nr:hypothetical protein CEY00_Acc12287 [Actinidia chinensis var. chinensis]